MTRAVSSAIEYVYFLCFLFRGDSSSPLRAHVLDKKSLTLFILLQLHGKTHVLEGVDVGVCGLMWWRKPENLGKTTDIGLGTTSPASIEVQVYFLCSMW